MPSTPSWWATAGAICTPGIATRTVSSTTPTADIANVGPYELHLGSAVDSPHKCQGDSGGPTFIDIYRNGWLQTVQIGLSSHLEGVSPTCENAAVDTRVDVYDTWIREQMRIFT